RRPARSTRRAPRLHHPRLRRGPHRPDRVMTLVAPGRRLSPMVTRPLAALVAGFVLAWAIAACGQGGSGTVATQLAERTSTAERTTPTTTLEERTTPTPTTTREAE